MTSSAYYATGETNYWPYHQQISDIRSFDSGLYNPNSFSQSTLHQQQQPQSVPLRQQQHQQHHQPPSPPSYGPESPPNHTPPSSLLETLLRHGKDAISEGYPITANGKSNSNAGQASTTSHMRSQTPPYTPSSSSDRTSPLSGLLMDTSSQERFQQPTRRTTPSIESNGIGYPQAPYQQAYAHQPSTGNCVTSMIKPSSPTSSFEAMPLGYSPSGGTNNNNGKMSPNADSEYGEDQPQRPVDYAWMKSNYANGE